MPRRKASASERKAVKTSGTEATSLANDQPSDQSGGAEPKQGAPGSKPAPGLYIVATPIGHAQDMTLRALNVLGGADAIACEDTRVTAKLLVMHGLKTKLLPYHEHNAERMRPVLLEKLRHGEAIALVSDAGTPLISDPGYKLVREAVAENLMVTSLPGPSAPLAALVLSGLPSDRFLFAGFLPPKSVARRAVFAELAAVPATLIFFETGPRLGDSLADMHLVLGDRPAAVARELTKLHEEIRRGTLGELAGHYQETGPPRGEIVVVVGGPAADAPDKAEDIDQQIMDALLHMSVREASEAIAMATGLPRRQIYARALILKDAKA